VIAKARTASRSTDLARSPARSDRLLECVPLPWSLFRPHRNSASYFYGSKPAWYFKIVACAS
jgi:hypothetical protein